MKSFLSKSAIIFAIPFVLLFSSCEIGLGPQVDVEPPTVTLTSPIENARTRKAITFEGSWTDDLTIDKITVVFKTTDGKISYGPFNSEIKLEGEKKTSGNWSCTVEPTKNSIPDGVYTILVTAYDTYEHATTVTRAITVDNTPPLIVLESPSTTSIDSPMSYGQTFSIIGRGADEQNGGTIDSIDAIIYNDQNVEIARKTFTNISTSIDFSVANWNDEGENFYKKIYGDNLDEGTKRYYLSLVAYDDARQVPAVEGDRGNSTGIIYLNNDLSVINGYKPQSAYNILSRNAVSETNTTLADALNTKKIEKLTFSLNPVNNPYFEVQGYEPMGSEPNLEIENYGFMNKNKLTVNIYAGRDKKEIKPESIGIYLVPCDAKGNILENQEKVTILEKGGLNGDGSLTENAIFTEEFKKSTTSCTWISKALNVDELPGFVIGKYYVVSIEAEDLNGVSIRNDNRYGIKVTTSNAAPILGITKPGFSVTVKNNEKFEIRGTIKTAAHISTVKLYKDVYKEGEPDGSIAEIKVEGELPEDQIGNITEKIVLNTTQTNTALRFYNFHCTVPSIEDESYTLLVVATDENKQFSQKEVSVENDRNPPEFDDSPTITPLVSSSKDESGKIIYKVNGTVTISQLISDDRKLASSLWSDDEPKNANGNKSEANSEDNLESNDTSNRNNDIEWKPGDSKSTPTNLIFTVDTTKYGDGEKTIWLKAYDASGNESETTIVLDIDQSTDAPKIELSNTECGTKDNKLLYNPEWTVSDYENAKKAKSRTVFGRTSNNYMLGTISDDDGIGSVTVTYQKIEKKQEAGIDVLNLSNEEEFILDTVPESKTTYSLKVKMPENEGTYLITIKVKDSKQEDTNYNSTTVGPFLVAVDEGAPKLKIETASGAFKTGEVEVKGTVDDKDATISRFTEKECIGDGGKIVVNPDGSWTDIIKEDSAPLTYYYKATDDYDQSSVEKFSFKRDSQAPHFKINTIQGDDISKGFEKYGTAEQNSYFMITGEVTDIQDSNGNGNYKVNYIDTDELENTTSGFSESEFYYCVRKSTDGEPSKRTDGETYDISKDGWRTWKITPADSKGYIGKWTVSLNFRELEISEGSVCNIYFAAKDGAGNISKISDENPVIKVTIDSTAPEIREAKVNEIAKTPVLTVVASDNVEINDERIAVYNNNSALEKDSKDGYSVSCKDSDISGDSAIIGKSCKTFTITLKKVLPGKNSYKVDIFDKAGNKVTSNEILIENNAPVIGSKNTGIPNDAYKIENEKGLSYSYIKEQIETTATVICNGENNKLSKVKWEDKEANSKSIGGELKPDNNGNIVISFSPEKDIDYEGKYITRTVTATNIYGEESVWSFNFILDSTAPKIDSEKLTLGNISYSSIVNFWYKSDTLVLAGKINEKGSGVSKIDYVLNNFNGDSNKQSGTIYANGASSGVESFSSIISGFTESKDANILKLTVTDKAGNKSEPFPISVKIDTTAPSLVETVTPSSSDGTGTETETCKIWYQFEGDTEWKPYNTYILTNATKTLYLAGSYKDESDAGIVQSGVKEVKISGIDVSAFSPEQTQNESENENSLYGNWKISIPAEKLGKENKNIVATVSISDIAGNVGVTENLNITVDKQSPKVTVEMPTAESTLNGLNTFSGKSTDNNDVKNIALYYYIGEQKKLTFSDFKLIENCSKDVDEKDTSLSDINAWKFENVNVNEFLKDGAERGIVYILPISYDRAGNCNVSGTEILDSNTQVNEELCTKIIVDLNSDRPEVKFNNLNSSGDKSYILTDTLNLSVEDDDGIRSFEYKFDGETEWKGIEMNAGSVIIPLGDDGKKSLSLRIKDTADGVFETGSKKHYKQPKVKYGNSDFVDNPSAIEFTKDTVNPVLGELTFTSGANAESTKIENFGTTNLVGGTEKCYVIFESSADDSTSGVASVTVSVSGIQEPYTLSKAENGKKYCTEPINVMISSGKTWSEGNHTLTFTVTDNAGHSYSETKQLTVDKTGPVATLITPSPADDEAQTGIVTLSGTANDEYSTVQDVRYLVLNNDYYTENGTLVSNVEAKVRETVTADNFNYLNAGSVNTWKFKLDGLPGPNGKNDLLPSNNEDLKNYSKVPHTEKGIYTLAVYFYTKDSLGNEALSSDTIKFNPYGDRPEAAVTFPTGASDSERANVSGSIRITGSAQDNVSVKEVFVQIDVDGDGEFTDTDKEKLEEMTDSDDSSNFLYEVITDTDYKTGEKENADLSAIGETFWGIKAKGTVSWNLTVNEYNEFLPTNQENKKVSEHKIAIRAVAVDNNYKFGCWSNPQYVMIDNNSPSIGSHCKLVNEYDNDSELKSTKIYSADMFVKGNAMLELSVEDKVGIKKVMYYIANTENELSGAIGKEISLTEENEQTWNTGLSTTKGYIVKIPLNDTSDTSSTGSTKYVKVVATKNSDTETTAYERFTINFDNTAPNIDKISLNGIDYDSSDKKVVNSNGTYFTFGGSVSDSGGSGFDKVLFYYYREGKEGNSDRIYDPMIDSTSNNSINKGRINVEPNLKTRVLGSANSQTIYGTEQTVNIGSDKRTFTIKSDDHIRVGGVVEIEGSWFTIEKLENSGTTITLATDAPVIGKTEVFFAYVQVIDNTGSEKTNADGDLTNGDDGDGMPESIIKNLNTWIFDAAIHSNYIPDGPITLVVFAFDKAGNVSAKSYDASVQNNAPRLTKLWLGTDLNGSGFQENSFTEYDILTKVGEKSSYEMATANYTNNRFRVKGDLVAVAEFVGGNNASESTDGSRIKMVFNKDATSDKAAFVTSNEALMSEMSETSDAPYYDSDLSKKNWFTKSTILGKDTSNFAFVINKSLLGADSEFTNNEYTKREMSFTFWDDTEETTQGINSCYSYLKITDFIVMIADSVPPVVAVNPLYWRSPEDNSLYENSYLNGHVDLPTASNATFDTTLGMFKNGGSIVTGIPDVSGHIVFRGSALDEHSLDSIWAKFTGFNFGSTSDSTTEDGYYKLWSKNNVNTSNGTGWNFKVTSDTIVPEGHLVNWELDIDTSKIDGNCGKNIQLDIMARDTAYTTGNTDHQSKIEASGSLTKDGKYDLTKEGVNQPSLTMNVVPYIKGVKGATRSRLGRYSVRVGETITLEGFNFPNKTPTVTRHKTDFVTGKASTQNENEKISATRNSANEITFIVPDYSGFINVSFNVDNEIIKCKNNENEDVLYNIQKGYDSRDTKSYGRTAANTNGKDFWTDDIYLSAWNSGNTAFANSSNPIHGTMEKVMSSYTKYIDSTASTNNLSDYGLVGVWGSEDNMMYDNILGFGRGKNMSSTASGAFFTPPSQVDICEVNGNFFQVVVDDSWKDAGTFGQGLVLLRDGHTTKTDSGDYKYSVEKTGTNEVRDQFQNVKIAGAFDGTNYHIYTSYYDRYTKCLKYAKIVYKGTIDTQNETDLVKKFVTGTSSDGEYVVDGFDSKDNTNITWDVGEFSDIKVDSSSGVPEPVLVYYVAGSTVGTGSLKIARPKIPSTTAPQSGTADDKTTQNTKQSVDTSAPVSGRADGKVANDVWSYITIPNPSGSVDFGRYVSMEMDSDGALHIVAQDVTNNVLYYGKFVKDGTSLSGEPKYKFSENGWQIVDATDKVGLWTDIKLENGKPVITYMNSAKVKTIEAVKIAYMENGVWECMTDPATCKAKDEKLSLVIKANDTDKKLNRYAIGINAEKFAIDFLRDEQ